MGKQKDEKDEKGEKDDEAKGEEGLLPYQRYLTAAQQKKCREIKKKMTALDEKMKLIVQDCEERDLNDPDEPQRDSFEITATAATTVEEIKKMVLDNGSYSEAASGPLKLVFEGKVLEAGMLSDYDLQRAKKKFSKPYGGILWIAPNMNQRPLQK